MWIVEIVGGRPDPRLPLRGLRRVSPSAIHATNDCLYQFVSIVF